MLNGENVGSGSEAVAHQFGIEDAIRVLNNVVAIWSSHTTAVGRAEM